MHREISTKVGISVITIIAIFWLLVIQQVNNTPILPVQQVNRAPIPPVQRPHIAPQPSAPEQTSTNNQGNKSPTNNQENNPAITEPFVKVTETGCDFLKNFEGHSWFEEMATLYKNELPKGDEGKFYRDYSDLGRKQACLLGNYFIFTPSEDIGGGGTLYSYDINKKKLTEAPESEEYFSDNITAITDTYVSFSGGGGSGECFYENQGKYFYKQNKIEITEECNYCMKSFPDKNDCKKTSKVIK